MSAASPTIPYEQQSDPKTSRMCGAACLSMVYRSLGIEVAQSEIWPVIAKENQFGRVASTTHLIAQDALNRGLSAVVLQARHPLQVLRICRDRGIRAILNHRLRRDLPAGHYSVFLDIDGTSVTLHDPLLGPSLRLTHAELLELWLPHFTNSEITGNVLIGVTAAGAPPAASCEFCRTAMPGNVECPRCNHPVGLEPSALLGCINDMCIARMWLQLCCPWCDFVWTFRAQPSQGGAATRAAQVRAPAEPEAGAMQSVDVEKLFGEVQKFCAHIESIPGAASHPEIGKLLDFMMAGKERFKLAQAEQLAHLAAYQAKMAAIIKATKEKEQAQRKKMEELNQPLRLDGIALARGLLKNLSFTP